MFANASGPLLLHPDLMEDQQRRERLSCRPLALDPAVVEPIWRELAARAVTLGFALPECGDVTDDPDLMLVADGVSVQPVRSRAGGYAFVLPWGMRQVRLSSRAVVPAEHTPWNADARRLGVMLGSLRVRAGRQVLPIALDDPLLQEGWWQPEVHAGLLRRWTDGDAVVPLPSVCAHGVLEVGVAGTLAYPISATANGGRSAPYRTPPPGMTTAIRAASSR